ncbi:NfeD family protein [Aureliella helgolandensis]|nr:peptidase [Aureliella helgolandensis]
MHARPVAPLQCSLLCVALLCVVGGVPFSASGQELEQQPPEQAAAIAKQVDDEVLARQFGLAVCIEVEGPIFGRFHWFLNQRLDWAKKQGADLVIIKLTSPGGDLEQSLQLARRLRDIDWATTMVYIPEEAISGGAIISLGAERIYMQEGALIGDAGPIQMGLDLQFRHAPEKIVSYLTSALAELANGQQRPAALAEAMADKSLTVYAAVERQTGQIVYLKESQTQEDAVEELYDIRGPVPETGQNRFLTLGADRALELRLCEGVFASERDFLQQLNIASLATTKMTWIDRTVFLLNRPWLTALLLIAGLIGLYFELIAPGISVAGLTALCCFGLFFWSHALGGTAGWLEVLLFALGIICLICELFVLPGFGVFGLCGFAFTGIALVMASQDFVIPNSAMQWNQLQTNLLIVLGAMLGVICLFVVQVLVLDSIPGLNRFRLATPEHQDTPTLSDGGSENNFTALTQSDRATQALLQVGMEGKAESDLRPAGKASFGSHLVDVLTEGDYVDADTLVAILRIEGNRVIVRAVHHA